MLSKADRIRAYALEHYVRPWRRSGEKHLSIRAGDIVRAMGLHNATPNVCSALEGRKFQSEAGISLIRREGPIRSTTTTFHYESNQIIPEWRTVEEGADKTGDAGSIDASESRLPSAPKVPENRSRPKEGHVVFQGNERGVTYAGLFGPYLDGARRITITDPYIRAFHQLRNLTELLEILMRPEAPESGMRVHLVTERDKVDALKQRKSLDTVAVEWAGTGVDFTWAYDGSGTAHARHIVTDTGWKILLDRGLDIFQRHDAFSPANRLQELRPVKRFEITYLRLRSGNDP